MINRNDFYLPDGICYLDNAATTQRLKKSVEAIENFYRLTNANPLRGLYQLSMAATDAYENARETVRKFINARSTKEIIFTRNATESLNLVAYTYGLQNISEGDEIVISIMEHHSNMLPWRMVAEQKKATVKYMECDEDASLPDSELLKITDKTKIVAIAQVSNVTGRRAPIEKIIKKAHSVGAIVVLDGAQSVPHMKVDVQALDVDFLAFSGHKMYGPFGIGVLYGKEDILDNMIPFMRGGEMIESVHLDRVTYAELPHKFEAGTVNAADAVGLAAACEYLMDIGMDNVERIEGELTSYLISSMKSNPYVKIVGSSKPEDHMGIASFTVEGVHPHDIASMMDMKNIAVRAGHHCAQPLMEYLKVWSTDRASLAIYNTREEIDYFVESLSQVRRLMGYGE